MIVEEQKARELCLYRLRQAAQKVVVFGSVADNRSDPDSDLDILLLPLPAASYWDFRHELEEALGLAMDLHTQHDDPKFLEKLLARGETIHAVP